MVNRSEKRAHVSPAPVVRYPVRGEPLRKLSASERRALKALQVSMFPDECGVDPDVKRRKGSGCGA